jgi:predicted dehydrogenase
VDDTIGVGIIGAGWITRAHALAIGTIAQVAPVGKPVEIRMLAARGSERGEAMATRLGIERFTTDWRELVGDPSVHVVVNASGVYGHREATEAALALGKPVLCEKPLGVDRHEARSMADAAAAAGVQAATGFNYRYLPAMRLARDIVARGDLGSIVHFRGAYLQDWAAVDTPVLPHNGSRSVNDYAHIVDFLHYLGGEAVAVQAASAKLTAYGPDVEDAYVAAVELAGGGLANLEASRVARGWKGRQRIEVDGTEGSLWWDMEDMNRLHVFFRADEQAGLGGFRDIFVTQPDHPFAANWWPAGHGVGWEAGFIHEWHDFLSAVVAGEPVPAHQATFEDGYRAAVVCDAILQSARDGTRVRVADLAVPVARA